MLDNNDDYNINNFIYLFLGYGWFQPYLNKIYGVATHNYMLKIYNVTFKESTSKIIFNDLYNTFSESETITTKNSKDLAIQINRP